jgi:STE24 endopeptidase
MKGLGLSLVFELALIEGVYALLAASPALWWLWAGLAMLAVTVLLANLMPVLLLPLFYKLTPLPDGDVKRRALALAARARTRVRGIYAMRMSDKTTAANAFVAGLGNTRRIVIGDTLLDHYTPDEIEVVVAHELGHQVHTDIPKLIAARTVALLGGLFVAHLALDAILRASPHYHGLSDPATMPLLAVALGAFGLVTLPLVNGASRWIETQADVYALETTGKPHAFISAMTRLANQNLAELDPAPWIEFLLHNHPAIGRRLAMGRVYAARQESETRP